MRLKRFGLMVITLALAANTASAQDEPRVGVVMGYPASIGIVWHVTSKLALRPEISVSSSTNELTATSTISVGGSTVTNSTTTSNDNWQLLTGVSALFYLTKHENLRTYVSPRWAYTRVESSNGQYVNAGDRQLGWQRQLRLGIARCPVCTRPPVCGLWRDRSGLHPHDQRANERVTRVDAPDRIHDQHDRDEKRRRRHSVLSSATSCRPAAAARMAGSRRGGTPRVPPACRCAQSPGTR